MNQKLGIFFTMLSATLLGLTPILCTYTYDLGATPETLVFLRNFFCIPVLYLILKIKKIDLRVTKNELFKIILISVFGITSTTLLLYSAYNYLPVGMVTTLHFLYPFFVMLIGFIFFKEHISNAKKVILLIATIGIFLFVDIRDLNGQEGIMYGIFISILSALTYALYMSGVDNLGLKHINDLKLTFYFSLLASITCFIYANLSDSFTVFEMEPMGIVLSFVIAMCTSFLAIFTLQLGIKSLGASTAAIFCMFEPVMAVFGGFIFLNERLTLMKMIGCTIILGSVILLSILNKNENKAQ